MSHAVYETRYHLVWAPKYRTWILKEKVREAPKELFEEILKTRDCRMEDMEIAQDHVHIFSSIRPKYSVGEMVRALKSVSAKEIFLRHPKVNKDLWGGRSWEHGYFARTVGDKITGETINNYIRYHRHEEKTSQQLEFDI
jgi:putative transposase